MFYGKRTCILGVIVVLVWLRSFDVLYRERRLDSSPIVVLVWLRTGYVAYVERGFCSGIRVFPAFRSRKMAYVKRGFIAIFVDPVIYGYVKYGIG